MFLLTLSRSIVFACQSFIRNFWLSLVTVFIIFLTLLSINFLFIINAISHSAVLAVKDRVDISIYFKTDVRDNKILEIKSHLETLPQVKSIVYNSPETNLNNFKQVHASDDNIQEALKELEKNPLGATLVIKGKELTDYPNILDAIDNPAYNDLIEKKSYDDNAAVIEKINLISKNIQKGGLIVSLIFIIIAALIVFNTVRITLFTHQNEIGIMKLVGASNWFVRAPFIIESVISALLACVINIILIYPMLLFLQPRLSSFFGGADFNVISYFNENFIIIFGGQLLGIILLSIISSSLALGKYLKV